MKKRAFLRPLTLSIAALLGLGTNNQAAAQTPTTDDSAAGVRDTVGSVRPPARAPVPNRFVLEPSGGAAVAAQHESHYSHSSHASHSSHSSHYSGS